MLKKSNCASGILTKPTFNVELPHHVEYSMNCDVVVIIIVIYHVTVSSNNPAIPFDSTQYNPDKKLPQSLGTNSATEIVCIHCVAQEPSQQTVP